MQELKPLKVELLQISKLTKEDKYDQDAIYPYLIDGKKALARAWISGLKNIHPIID